MKQRQIGVLTDVVRLEKYLRQYFGDQIAYIQGETKFSIEVFFNEKSIDPKLGHLCPFPIFTFYTQEQNDLNKSGGNDFEINNSVHVAIGELEIVDSASDQSTLKFKNWADRFSGVQDQIINEIKKIWKNGVLDTTDVEQKKSTHDSSRMVDESKEVSFRINKPKQDALIRVAVAFYSIENGDVHTRTSAAKRFKTHVSTMGKYEKSLEVIRLIDSYRASETEFNRARSIIAKMKRKN